MKNLNQFIIEKFKINKNTKFDSNKVFYDEVFNSYKEFRNFVSNLKEFDTNALSYIHSCLLEYPIYFYILNGDLDETSKLGNFLKTKRDNLKINANKLNINSFSTSYGLIMWLSHENFNNYFEIGITDKKNNFLYYIIGETLQNA